MTPDGITDCDWEKVEILCRQVVKVAEGPEPRCRKAIARLHGYLDRLEQKYGILPSILATKADYAATAAEKIILLERAWESAQERNDFKNQTFIASSITEAYLDDVRNTEKARVWLEKFNHCLAKSWDDDEYHNFQKFARKLETI